MNRECACCGNRLLVTYSGDLCSVCLEMEAEEVWRIGWHEGVKEMREVKPIGLGAFDNYLEA